MVIKRRNELWQPCLFLWEIIKTQSAKDGRAGNFLLFPQLLANTEHLQCQSDKQDRGGEKKHFFFITAASKRNKLVGVFQSRFQVNGNSLQQKIVPQTPRTVTD